MRVSSALILLSALFAAAPCARAQSSAADDFNRPNGTNMGPDWVEGSGDTAIENNRGKGVDPFMFKGWMHHASFTGNYVDSVQSVDFLANGGAQAVILMAGFNPATWGCVSVKIQDNNGDQLFDRVFFEQAFNAGSWGSGSPVKYDLAVPTASGRMKVYFTGNGDVAVCEIANDASGKTETCSAGGILSFTYPINGTNFGIGHMGNVYFDNWHVTIDKMSYGAGCPGTGGFVPKLSASNNPVAGAPISITLDQALGGSYSLLFFGLTKTSVPMGYGSCQLLISPLLPLLIQVPLGGSGAGNGSATLAGVIPASATGATFTMQGFVADPGTADGYCNSNGLEFVVP